MSPHCNCGKDTEFCRTPYTCGKYKLDDPFMSADGDNFNTTSWELIDKIIIKILIGLALAFVTTLLYFFK